jgi:hypothetical protein
MRRVVKKRSVILTVQGRRLKLASLKFCPQLFGGKFH